MTVAVVIRYHDEACASAGAGGPAPAADPAAGSHQRPDYLPVATEAEYASHWLPAARALHCVWLPLFQHGCTVPLEDLPAVRAELTRLRDHFAAASGSDDAGIAHRQARSRWLVAQLDRLDPKAIAEIFFG